MKRRLPLFDPWVWKMAVRDSRAHRRKLLLFTTSIVLGTAALVAIGSLGENLATAIDAQARTLLGADLMITGTQELPQAVAARLDSISQTRSQQVSFSSMVLFPKSGDTRLAAVRALAGGYPYYGVLETEPVAASQSYRQGGFALVDKSLMIQFGASVGDSIKIGHLAFAIAGALKRIPGEAIAAAMIGPRIYIPLRYLRATRLIRRGSLATFTTYVKLPEKTDVTAIERTLKPVLRENRLRLQTVATRKQSLGRSMTNLYRFLNLVGFIALLLGCVGVASAVHVYIKHKLNTIAFLHCVGAETGQTFTIYLLQAAGMGLLGALAGSALGVGIQGVIPRILADFLPFDLALTVSATAIAKGLILGLGLALLFALLPLLSVRDVSPLLVLRTSFEPMPQATGTRQKLAVFLLIFAAISGFAITQSGRLSIAFGFVFGLAAVFLLLAATAKLLIVLVRNYFPASRSYILRQGLANLHRPHNQTITMMVALGLGTFLISTLYLTQQTLLKEVSFSGSGNQPNMVFFDIQPDQVDGMAALLEAEHLPVLQRVPIVTMRIASIKGEPVTALLADSSRGRPRWALRREYRSTYRERLIGTEALIAGRFAGHVSGPEDSVLVSLEESIAEQLDVQLGDEIVFDVQGVPIKTRVGSLRRVDWRRVQPNFFVVFPAGVLEAAPQFHVIVTRVASNEASAALQRQVVQAFPNVSTIDLSLILRTLDAILEKIAFVIRFMALFSIATGLTVLAGAVMTSRFQRIQESVLLRTIGASSRQIRLILILEYGFLGAIASLTGLLLSIAASWALSSFVFEAGFSLAVMPVLVIFMLVTLLTVFLGMLNSRGVASRPPLEILRSEI